jgi:hypothetical protein
MFFLTSCIEKFPVMGSKVLCSLQKQLIFLQVKRSLISGMLLEVRRNMHVTSA